MIDFSKQLCRHKDPELAGLLIYISCDINNEAILLLPKSYIFGWPGASIDRLHENWKRLIEENNQYFKETDRFGTCPFTNLIFFKDELEAIAYELTLEIK